MISSRAILEPHIKYFRGFLPINKPKGLSCTALINFMSADLNWTMEQSNITHQCFSFKVARQLETFANGLVTLIAGPDILKARNFVLSEYKYRVKIELGVVREFNCIEGKITGTQNAQHVTPDLIYECSKSLIGCSEQVHNRMPYGLKDDSPKHFANELEMIYQAGDTPFELPYWMERNPHKVQKYPRALMKRAVNCYEILLEDFSYPYATMIISCTGSFVIRQFVSDLAAKLNTLASVISMTRFQEGPMNLDDLRVFQFHEADPENYVPKIGMMRDFYHQYLKQFDDCFEKPKNRRL